MARLPASIYSRLALCMRTAGFDYIQLAIDEIISPAHRVPRYSRDYAALYGFGVSTQLDLMSETMNDDLVQGAGSLDRRSQSLLAMDEATRDAYWFALIGSLPTDVVGSNPVGLEDGGCHGEVKDKLGAFGQTVLDRSAVDRRAELEATTEFLAAKRSWQDCMRTGGYRFEDSDDIVIAIVESVEQLQAGEKAEYASFVELAEFERRTALQSWDCDLPARQLLEADGGGS